MENELNSKNFWYIACQSQELSPKGPIARIILDEWIVLFRDQNGHPVALQDRCIHRNFQLSKGQVKDGCLRCPYHGWTYDKNASVINIPAEGPQQTILKSRKAKKYHCIEKDDLIYICLDYQEQLELQPFAMPHYKEKGFMTVRLFNKFENNVTNCAENYVDVPHTVFVHDEIFRVSKQQKIEARCTRENGSVCIDYKNETNNLGWFSWFLNPNKNTIIHRDFFHMPNITSVEYIFSPNRKFYITSQCVPVNDKLTHVYTDLTYQFGIFNKVAYPIVRYQGQSVIDQDIDVLANQMKVINKYGENFNNSKADIIHILIESIRNDIEKNKDPRNLKKVTHDFEFWI